MEGLAWIFLHAGLCSLLHAVWSLNLILLSKFWFIYFFGNSLSVSCAILFFPLVCFALSIFVHSSTILHYLSPLLSLSSSLDTFANSTQGTLSCQILFIWMTGMEHLEWLSFSYLTFWIKRTVLVNLLFRWSWYLQNSPEN